MNQEVFYTLRTAWQNKWVRVAAISLPLFVIGVAILIAIFQAPKPVITKTNLLIDNHPKFVNGLIAAYNGNSFFTIDPAADSKPHVVFTPKYRLPEVSSIIWANQRGVLLNFKSGINYTPVGDYLSKEGYSYGDSAGYYTWYLDFADGQLHLVDTYDLENENSVVYSEKDNGFYFIPNIKYSDTEPGRNTLKFYDIATHKTETAIDPLNLNVSFMSQCETNKGNVCIIGREDTEAYGTTSIYALSRGESPEVLSSYEGTLLPSPIKNTFVLLGKAEAYMETDTLYKSVSLINAATNTTEQYSGTIFGSNAVVGMLGKDPYVLDGKNDEYLALHKGWSGNKTQTGSLGLGTIDVFSDGYLVLKGLSNTDIVLISTIDKAIYAVGQKHSAQRYSKKDEKSIENIVKDCTEKVSAEYKISGYSITIYVYDTEFFNDSLRITKECIGNNADALLGYIYTYRGIDKTNGRITTD